MLRTMTLRLVEAAEAYLTLSGRRQEVHCFAGVLAGMRGEFGWEWRLT